MEVRNIRFPRTVYAIQHNITKRIYVGSSNNIESRYWGHMSALRNHKHNVEDMQSDFNEYGEDYSLFILDEIKEFSERRKEYEWMGKLKSNIRGIGYNYKDNAKPFKKPLPLKSGIPQTRES